MAFSYDTTFLQATIRPTVILATANKSILTSVSVYDSLFIHFLKYFAGLLDLYQFN